MFALDTRTGDNIYDDTICNLLMENHQIQTGKFNKEEVFLSKGRVNFHVKVTSENSVKRNQSIDEEGQKNIIPYMLYRYICYEEKDYRFCTKSINFSDENYYFPTVIDEHNKSKSVKLAMICNPLNETSSDKKL